MIYGIIGFALAAALFISGFLLGWRMRGERYRAPTPEELGEQERKRLISEQNAFRELINYNTDVAYGLETDVTGEEE